MNIKTKLQAVLASLFLIWAVVSGLSSPLDWRVDWTRAPRSFDFGQGQVGCQQLLSEREHTSFLLPTEYPRSAATVKEVADWWRLDPQDVCAENPSLPPPCAAQSLRPGDPPLRLPLHRGQPRPSAPRASATAAGQATTATPTPTRPAASVTP